MIKLSPNAKNLKPSPTLAVNAKAQELRAQGREILDLSVGEPDFPTPEPVRKAAEQAIEEGWTKYAPVAGLPELRKAISKHLKERKGYQYSPAEIAITVGAKQALFNAILSCIGPGDEVIIPRPYWVSYPTQTLIAGGKPVFIDTSPEDEFQISSEKLEPLLTPSTKAVILNSPSNPTGAIYSEKTVRELAELLTQHPNLLIISDEIYDRLVYDDNRAHGVLKYRPELRERTIVIDGFSKAYAMTGWRIGFLAAPREVVRTAIAIQGASTSGAAAFTQRAALKALSPELEPTIEKMRLEFQRRRDLIVELFSALPKVKVRKPKGAFYLFADFSQWLGSKRPDGKAIENTVELSEFILEKAGVAGVPGEAFGTPGFIRFSYAADTTTLKRAAEKIDSALKKLK